MDELAEGGALRAGRPAFVAAALAERGVAAVLASTLERVPGVRSVTVAAGLADPDGGAPRRAIVATALLDAPRSALDLGAELALQLRSGRSDPARDRLRGLGVAASADAPDASLDTLIAVALEGARVAPPGRGGGLGIAHSELYELEARRRSPAFRADPGGATEAPTPGAIAGGAGPRDGSGRDTLRPRPAPRDREHLRALEVRAHAALLDQLRAEVEGLRAERARTDRADRRADLEQRLVRLAGQLGEAEVEARRLGLGEQAPA